MSKKKKIALHWKIIIGMILGVVWALLSAQFGWKDFTLNWIDPWGKIFINSLKLIALPLVFFSIIIGVASLSDISKLGRMGAKTLGAYLITTVFAITIGLTFVNIFKPGKGGDKDQLITNRISYELWVKSTDGVEFLYDDIRLSEDTKYRDKIEAAQVINAANSSDDKVVKNQSTAEKTKNARPLQPVIDLIPSNIVQAFHPKEGAMLQVIMFAIFFGISLALIPKDRGEAVFKFVDGFNEVFIKMVNIIMLAAPFFVFALLAGKMAEMAGDDPQQVIDIFYNLGKYCLVVLFGLGLMIFAVYPLLLKIFVKERSYRGFFKGIGKAQITAFSTSSSAATLPVTLDCVKNGLGVSKNVTNFVLPIGATVNMDGTSLYQAVAVIFLAQYHMVDLDIATQLTIVGTATLASIGSAAVPGAGLIMLMLILESVGLNPAWIAIIIPVDRILDMCRTVVNVTGDAAVSTIIAKSEGELEIIED